MSTRRELLRQLAVTSAALAAGCRPRAPEPAPVPEPSMNAPAPDRMPVLFVGHGSPMNVVEHNVYSRGFVELGQRLPRPSAVLAVSAHWYVRGTLLTDGTPRTIHDFGNFPQALYEIEYPAPGRAELAHRVRGLLGEARASLSTEWGLDHGTWTVLRWMYPDADIPVVQLSIDRALSPSDHVELARSLGALRDEGVLVLGSGNVTHNLRDAFGRSREGNPDTPDWARRFDTEVAEASEAHDVARLASLLDTEHGRLAHPTPEHYLPLLYAAAASEASDAVSFTSATFDWGSLSMRNVLWG